MRHGTKKIAFNTVSLVGRVSGYRFQLANWSKQYQRTVQTTNEAAWYGICQDIEETGFSAVEIWEAHAAPETMNEARASLWLQIMEDHGLYPVAYAGSLRPETLQVCQWLDISMLNGQSPLPLAEATELCRRYGIRFNLENHREKSAAELLRKIEGGNEWLGLCIETGWLATQRANGSMVIRDCNGLVRHVHLKDIEASGAHDSCLLGTGEADLEECIQALHDINFDGWCAFEDTPELRNPLETALENRQWMEMHL